MVSFKRQRLLHFIHKNESLMMLETKGSKSRRLTLRLQYVLMSKPLSRCCDGFSELPRFYSSPPCVLEIVGPLSNSVRLYNTVFCLCLKGDDNGTTETVLVFAQSLCGMQCLDGWFMGELARWNNGLGFCF